MEGKARLALNREQRAAMIGRDGNMQVRQRLQPGSWALWRLGSAPVVRCTYWDGPGRDFHFSSSVLTSACILLPFVPHSCPQHCVGPGKAPAGCNEFSNATQPDQEPKNWSHRRKVTEQMVPLLPALVGAPLCNICYNTSVISF
jgi:hypothetical protein